MSAENPSQPAQAESTAPASGGGGGTAAIALNIGYVKSIPGILKIVEFFLLLLAFSCVASTVGSWDRKSFFLFVTIVCWLLVIAIFVIFLLTLEKMISINWNLVILVNSVVWAVLLLISSALLGDNASAWKNVSFYVGSFYGNLVAGVVFGFFSMIVVALDGAYHFYIGVLKKN